LAGRTTPAPPGPATPPPREVELRAEGWDAKEALDALAALIEAGFNETDCRDLIRLQPRRSMPGPTAPPAPQHQRMRRNSGAKGKPEQRFRGTPVSPGVAIGAATSSGHFPRSPRSNGSGSPSGAAGLNHALPSKRAASSEPRVASPAR